LLLCIVKALSGGDDVKGMLVNGSKEDVAAMLLLLLTAWRRLVDAEGGSCFVRGFQCCCCCSDGYRRLSLFLLPLQKGTINQL
jgi:hypothetical protein